MESSLVRYPLKIEDWSTVRKELHRYPEISGHEKNTSQTIARYLEQFLPDKMIRGIARTGILAVFEGQEKGPTTWFRAELDGLPLSESPRDHRSHKPDVAHLCGHDGHMTILLALAQKLYREPPRKGRIGLLFQPAEETGAGAEKMVRSRKIRPYRPDRIFAIHNLPGFPKETVILRSGLFTSSVISLSLRFKGKTAHAGEPHKAVNPGSVILDLWAKAQEWTNSDLSSPEYAIVTPVHFVLGTRDYGISPGNGEIHFTIRTHSDDRLRELLEKIEDMAEQRSEKLGLELIMERLQYFPAVINDSDCIRDAERSAGECQLDVLHKDMPFAWGEDFSRYLASAKGALIGWGAGESCAPLHHPDYDFPDDQIAPAAGFFHSLAKRYHD